MKVKLNGFKFEDTLKVIERTIKMERKTQKKRIRKIRRIRITKINQAKNLYKLKKTRKTKIKGTMMKVRKKSKLKIN